MKTLKSPLYVGTLLILLLSQTGCVVGLIRGKGPMAAIGAGVAAAGGAVLYFNNIDGIYDSPNAAALTTGAIMGITGIILAAENPGREVSLNPLPLSIAEAKKLGVSLEDLENYNDLDLNQVLETNTLIENAVADIQAKPLSTRSLLNDLAPELGVKNGKKLWDLMSGDALSTEELRAFAKARNLSAASAKIYLQERWSVKFTK